MKKILHACCVLALGLGLLGLGAPTVRADVPGGTVVRDSAAPGTPHVLDGEVLSIARVGNQVILAGSFSRVRNDGSTTEITRRGLVAFDADTGQVNTAFDPAPGASTRVVLPAGDGTHVYVGGGFTSIGGVARSRVARVRVADGAVDTTFNAGTINGAVRDLALGGGRLWLGGLFTHVAGRAQPALATVNAGSGAFSTFMGLTIAGYHREGASSVLKMDLAADGSRLVAVGNFDTLQGVRNHQLLVLDTSGASAQPSTFQTDFYTDACSAAFTTYMRDVDLAGDGSFFVVSTTGAYGGSSSACDTTARFETRAAGPGVRPSWINHTGGDTTYGVEVTDAAVYVGGHQRWQNNPFAGDNAGPGAVARQGIAALDPVNGLPLTWDPGRARGVGVFDFLLDDRGLWVGSDTDRINGQLKSRIALLLRGGASRPAVRTPTLPADLYVGGATGAASDPRVLYRVNAGGPALPGGSGPDWAADTDAAPSPLHNAGSNRAGYAAVPTVDATVPVGTPRALFDTELWDPAGGTEQQWDLPVPAGTPIEVRLYLANRCTCTAATGQRRFHVDLDGSRVLTDLDLSASPGHDVGTMRAFSLTSDGTVDLDLTHVVENPLLNGIEVVRTDLPAPAPAGLDRRAYADGAVGPVVDVPDGGLDWSTVRGAFMVNGMLYLGHADGSFTRRTFDGSAYGAPSAVDGSDRVVPLAAWHSELSSVTGLFLDDGRVYFTLAGDPQLYYRYFTPESGVVGAQRYVASAGVPGLDLTRVRGMFLAGSQLYLAQSSGDLLRVDWQRGGAAGRPVAGTATAVSGPAVGDGRTWGARALFLFQDASGGGGATPPTAGFTSACSGLVCTFDAGSSTAAGGAPASYAWTFGDGAESSGTSPQHAYATPGTYPVMLTVTDDGERSDSVTQDVTVAAPAADEVTFVASATGGGTARNQDVVVPGDVRAGDLMLLTLALNASDVTVADPDGWTRVHAAVGSNIQGLLYARAATAADAGARVRAVASAAAKGDATLLAYRGIGGAATLLDSALALDQTSGTDHVTPAVTATAGDWLVTGWTAKSSTDVTWSIPGSLTSRSAAADTGGGRLTSVSADSAGPIGSGPAGSVTGTTSVPVTRVVMLSAVVGR